MHAAVRLLTEAATPLPTNGEACKAATAGNVRYIGTTMWKQRRYVPSSSATMMDLPIDTTIGTRSYGTRKMQLPRKVNIQITAECKQYAEARRCGMQSTQNALRRMGRA